MRRFNNEDIVLSENASINLLTELFIKHSDPSTCIEFENVTSEDTLDGAVYCFPGLDIDLDALETEKEAVFDKNIFNKKFFIRYQTEITVKRSTKQLEFPGYENSFDKLQYHSSAADKEYLDRTTDMMRSAA